MIEDMNNNAKEENFSSCLIITACVEGFPLENTVETGREALCNAFAKEMLSRSKNAFVICADGGYNIAKSLGIKPNLVLGDFDSCVEASVEADFEAEDEQNFVPKIIKVSPIKDDTDTGLCIKEAIARGFTSITIIGGVGGNRFSHTLGNLALLANYASQGISINLKDTFRTIDVLCDGQSLKVPMYYDLAGEYLLRREYISLFSYSEICENVNIKGVYYPLKDATLTNKFPLGVSNEFIEDFAEISLGRGLLIVIAE